MVAVILRSMNTNAKLLTLREWVGVAHTRRTPDSPPAQKQTVAMYTELPLAEAIARIKEYESAYRERFESSGMVAEFTLLGVSNIEAVGASIVSELAVDCVETLMESFD